MIKRNKKLRPFSLWMNPRSGKIIPIFKPIKLNTPQNIRNIPRRNLTWNQASIRYPRLNPFKDSDRDGKLNMFDCRPFNKKRHGFEHQYSFSTSDKEVRTVKMPPKMFLETTYADTMRSIEKKKRENKKRGIIPKHPYQYENSSYEDYEKDFTNKKIKMKEMQEVIKSKEKHVPIPFLDFNDEGENIGHEGRHTSAAAISSKLKYIPVTMTISKGKKFSPEYERLEQIKGKQFQDYNSSYSKEEDIKKAKRNTAVYEEELSDQNNNQIPDKAEFADSDKLLKDIEKEYELD